MLTHFLVYMCVYMHVCVYVHAFIYIYLLDYFYPIGDFITPVKESSTIIVMSTYVV